MRAWLMDSYDGVEHLRLGEVTDPQPGPAQVLLKVRFAALNPADAFLARGMYPARPPLPHILGRDGVGDVLAMDSGVENARVGQTVAVLRGSTGVEAWGTLAEKVLVPSSHIVPIPKGWSVEEIAGAPLVFLTAWQALTQWSEPPAPASRRVGAPGDRRLRRGRHGLGPAWEIDESDSGGVVSQRREGYAHITRFTSGSSTHRVKALAKDVRRQ